MRSLPMQPSNETLWYFDIMLPTKQAISFWFSMLLSRSFSHMSQLNMLYSICQQLAKATKNNEFRLICRSVFYSFFHWDRRHLFRSRMCVCVSLIINCSKWKVFSLNARLCIFIHIFAYKCIHVNQKNSTVFCCSWYSKRTIKTVQFFSFLLSYCIWIGHKLVFF